MEELLNALDEQRVETILLGGIFLKDFKGPFREAILALFPMTLQTMMLNLKNQRQDILPAVILNPLSYSHSLTQMGKRRVRWTTPSIPLT